MSKLPRTMEYEHTSWSEDDPLCAQLKRRADAMRDELLARIAVMLTTIGSRDGDLKKTFDSLGIAVSRIAELEAAVRDRNVEIGVNILRAEQAEAALEDMAQQFAYPGDGPVLSTGGLSALEGAFDVLGWEDPHPVLERQCDEPGCTKMATSGTPSPTGYRRVCGRHWADIQARAEEGNTDA